MIRVDEKERIRRAYLLQRKSIRQIAREFRHARRTVRKAIYDPAPPRYTRVKPTAKPVLPPFTAIIDQWLEVGRLPAICTSLVCFSDPVVIPVSLIFTRSEIKRGLKLHLKK